MSPKGMSSVMAGDTPFETARVLYEEITEIVTEDLAPLLQPMGFGMKQTYRKNVRRLPDGGRVDRATVTYEFQGMMADQMKGVFDFMFGGNEQVTEIGDTGAGIVAVWDNDDTEKALDDAVARLRGAADFTGRAWPSASKELTRALDEARGVTTAAFEVRMGGYMAMVLSMMKAQPGMDVFLRFEEEEIAALTKNDVPVVGWAGADKGRLLIYERVPMAAVKNIVEFVEKMQQRVGRGGGWEEPGPGPDDPVEVW